MGRDACIRRPILLLSPNITTLSPYGVSLVGVGDVEPLTPTAEWFLRLMHLAASAGCEPYEWQTRRKKRAGLYTIKSN